jgi:hypothetical protein
MKVFNLIIRALFSIFLAICIGVHIYGLLTHFNNESNASHVVHLISYSLCFYAFLKPINYRLALYSFGSIYPFLYHAHCAWLSYAQYSKWNGVCILVVVMLPLGALWVWQEK